MNAMLLKAIGEKVRDEALKAAGGVCRQSVKSSPELYRTILALPLLDTGFFRPGRSHSFGGVFNLALPAQITCPEAARCDERYARLLLLFTMGACDRGLTHHHERAVGAAYSIGRRGKRSEHWYVSWRLPEYGS